MLYLTMIRSLTVAMALAGFMMSTAQAEDPPQSPQKFTLPGTGGYGWGSGTPQPPAPAAPAMGASVGVQYPPDKGPTTVTCTRNGVRVPC